MARVQTIVQLSDELVAALDAEAAREGVSRSAVIREAVTAYLAERSEAEAARQIVAGYRRIPPATPDEWGEPAQHADAATVETMQRLDAEERAAGLEPW